jgi:hypothetical protein
MIGEMESTYFQSIVLIRDKNKNTDVPLNTCSIQKVVSTYSNTKVPIFKLVVNTTPISRNNSYVVRYSCQSCNTQSEITLNLFMRKVNKHTTRCESCRNQDIDKCNTQSNFMKENFQKIIAGEYIKEIIKVKSSSLETHIQKSVDDYEMEDDDFKNIYFLKHLSIEDYVRVIPKILSFGNDKITELNDWNYFPTFRIYNQTRYTPMLIHKTENRTEKPHYIKFKCDNCECEFIHRDLEIVKNHIKILCQTCSLTNRVFHLRKKILKNGAKLKDIEIIIFLLDQDFQNINHFVF